MSLPELIEIVPLDKPVRAEITVPGSKSITNRALILAAPSEGETELRGALWSDDTQVMVESLRRLGLSVDWNRAAATMKVSGSWMARSSDSQMSAPDQPPLRAEI